MDKLSGINIFFVFFVTRVLYFTDRMQGKTILEKIVKSQKKVFSFFDFKIIH